MKLIANIGNVYVYECGYKPPRVKTPEIWFNVYVQQDDRPHQQTLNFKTFWNLHDAFSHMMQKTC